MTFSPRVWGCTENRQGEWLVYRSFPHACGDVPYTKNIANYNESRFPHACGDVPLVAAKPSGTQKFSPRVWGCTALEAERQTLIESFPHACGDVPSQSGIMRYQDNRFPHACGDVPSQSGIMRYQDNRFPHACGDVPISQWNYK